MKTIFFYKVCFYHFYWKCYCKHPPASLYPMPEWEAISRVVQLELKSGMALEGVGSKSKSLGRGRWVTKISLLIFWFVFFSLKDRQRNYINKGEYNGNSLFKVSFLCGLPDTGNPCYLVINVNSLWLPCSVQDPLFSWRS